MSVTPLWIGHGESRLFGVLHEPATAVRAGVLVCPPFLHEYVRSHRLFSQLGEELSALGFVVLRFDYTGTGDSHGADESFSMPQTVRDASMAAARLRAQVSGVPMIALGVRAGVHAAAALLREGQVDRLWLWQPILDGAAYLRRLRERQALEVQSPMRYTMAKTLQACDAHTLMGYPCTAELADQLAQAAWSDAGLDAARVTLLEKAATSDSPAHSRLLPLPDALTAWADELDMARVAGPPVKAIAGELASTGMGA
jgi:alpha-beta hydrolase superfamily lysophospholipase